MKEAETADEIQLVDGFEEVVNSIKAEFYTDVYITGSNSRLPVLFDENIVKLIEKHAGKRGMSCRRITSGAGQDAQNMALLCPTAMIFAPSANGISHNPKEYTSDEDLLACARVFMDVMEDLAED